jgi:hypothetical protein
MRLPQLSEVGKRLTPAANSRLASVGVRAEDEREIPDDLSRALANPQPQRA